MDRSNAKMLTLVPLFLLGITIVMFFLILLVLVPIFLLMGLGIGFGMGSGAGIVLATLLIIVIGLAMLLPMIFPIIALFIGYFRIYKPISKDEYSENTKVFIIVNIVICFIFGGGMFGWIAAILYIILLVSWNDLAYPERKAYYYPPPEEYPRGEKPRSKNGPS